ncbi:MAG: hypothetical protein IJH57_03490 [Mogibacterium sp.]|nr:hypothetical protein [Mogibacterium sp.]
MKLTELLEKDKDHLLTEISAAGTAEKAVAVLEKEVDKLLLTHNDAAGSDAERNSAAHMMQAVRLSLPFMDSLGSTKVFEKGVGESGPKKKTSIAGILLVIAALILLVYGLMPLIMLGMNAAETANARNDLITRGISILMGAAALYLSGTMQNKTGPAKKKEYHVEQKVDADRIYRNFRTVMISVDQSLDEVRLTEKQAHREQAGKLEGREASPAEIELFSDLLAASYSGDPEFALEKIAGIKYYLHRQQIEVVDYSEDNASFFDMMPGASAGTIRPAMIADGKLLKKGLASKGN